MKWLRTFRPDENNVSKVISDIPRGCRDEISVPKEIDSIVFDKLSVFEKIEEGTKEAQLIDLRIEGNFNFWC